MKAIVVGSGPNGLVAAVTLAQHGWEVTVLEAASTPGGGMRTQELTLPGVAHDVCSAIHPLAVASPALRALPLAEHGLDWIEPEVAVAHPLEGGAAILERSLDETASGLGADATAYRDILAPHVAAGTALTDGLLSPLELPPRHPLALARFGVVGVRSAEGLTTRRFTGDAAPALFAGVAAHSILPLTTYGTAGYGLLLSVLGHVVGWPLARGGSQRIAEALVSLLRSLGGRIECDQEVRSLDALPPVDATLLDLAPSQVLRLASGRLPARYARRLARFRHGPGVFKLDWALDGPIPWSDENCLRAGTVHVGGTAAEIVAAEDQVQRGLHPPNPFVLVAQQSLFDPSRAPAGVHTGWAYCHVPNGSGLDMTDQIEGQIERFAPGFRDRILGRHAMGTAAVEDYNPNYRGGDIAGGRGEPLQWVARPTLGLHPWRTPVEGLYLCSASTPPGAGVHGMCGFHAAREVLRSRRKEPRD